MTDTSKPIPSPVRARILTDVAACVATMTVETYLNEADPDLTFPLYVASCREWEASEGFTTEEVARRLDWPFPDRDSHPRFAAAVAAGVRLGFTITEEAAR